jgi:unsaturated chondroitin disaccharide hydrolase
MTSPPRILRRGRLAVLAIAWPAMASELAWTRAEERSAETVAWMTTTYGSSGMLARYPTIGNLTTGRWTTTANVGDWRAGFWPGALWMIAAKTGSPTWRQRATDWSAALATTTNGDHDIGFIVLGSVGKGWSFHDDVSDPGGTYREFARQAMSVAAAKLDARFNKPNGSGTVVPAGLIRSWDTIEAPYPVCIDNLMNLELLLAAYELNGRQPDQRPWFDHALTHARNSIARHLRADGGSYHVVKHFETGTSIGQIERKSTRQGYGDETTWSRGEAWAIYGLTAVYRHARRDPGTDASDILAAAEAVADYFLDHLPDAYTTDSYNHRVGDFVPPCDFDAALGEPEGPWNDANNNYNSTTGSGLGDRRPATHEFTPRDSSAAAIAAAGLIELSEYSTDGARYLAAAEDILNCLEAYDSGDSGSAPDYLCAANESAHPGILKAGSQQWDDDNRSLSYGDYYFLEALVRREALQARALIAASQSIRKTGSSMILEFESLHPSPALAIRIQQSDDLATWTTVAAKTGAGAWSGAAVNGTPVAGKVKVTVTLPASGSRGFLRIVTRSMADGLPP